MIAALVAVYAVSQFLRNSVGVIAKDLSTELSLGAAEIGVLSSSFFLAFAAAQIPVGIAIDRYGPKRAVLGCAALCLSGIMLFATARSGAALVGARALMGVGCASFFMAPLAIYARRFAPGRFAALTSIQIGFGSTGTLLATAPLAASTAEIGWRASFWGVAAATAAVAVLVIALVPADRPGAAGESWGETFRGVGAAMRVPSFWRVFLAHATAYAAFATVLGLWAGPWLSDVYGVGLEERGAILLAGALAQIVGLFAWGLSDRFWRSYRRPVLLGSGLTAGLLAAAALVPLPLAGAVAWLVLFGFCVAYTPLVTAHGKSLFPGPLTGRGITLLNVGTMGGVFVFQAATGALVDLIGCAPGGAYPPEAYRAAFALMAVGSALSLVPYAKAVDAHPSHATDA
jgi:MFS family permease